MYISSLKKIYPSKQKIFIFFLGTVFNNFTKKDYLFLKHLKLKATMFFTLFIVTHINIINSDISNLCFHKFFITYRTFCYHLKNIF